jgi:hypothetical protein
MIFAINQLKWALFLFTFTSIICSCEQIIKVKLQDGLPNVVIESAITNRRGPFTVKISQSQDYYDQSAVTGIEKAQVQISDSSLTETLVEKGSGYYLTQKIKGIPGNTYHLNVASGGKNYNAMVKLPSSVAIDTVYFESALIDNDSLNVFVEFNDPRGIDNYYRIKLYRNGRIAVNDYYLISDVFSDGLRLFAPFYYREFAPGDTVVVELDNLEQSTWRYFKGLSEIIQFGVNVQAPGNPLTNITGGALGYFGAWSSYTYKVIIPK